MRSRAARAGGLAAGALVCAATPLGDTAARADVLGLSMDVLSFDGIEGWDDEIVVLDVFVDFDEPADELNVVWGEPLFPLLLTTSAPDGFINPFPDHPFGQGPPPTLLLPLMPALHWDTFATIGIDSYVGSPLPFSFTPEFELYPLEGTEVFIDNGGWYVIPGAPVATAGSYPDLRVRFLRLSFRRPACTGGLVSLIIRSDDIGEVLRDVSFAACTTPVGAAVETDLQTPAAATALVSFEAVLEPGVTTLAAVDFGPAVPGVYRVGTPPRYDRLTTTALHTGAHAAVSFGPPAFDHQPLVRLLRRDGDQWIDVTSFPGAANGVIAGDVTLPAQLVVAEIVDPSFAIADLIGIVAGLDIRHGVANSLTARLDAALRLMQDGHPGNDGAAANMLRAFLAHLAAQRGQHVPPAAADFLRGMALSILELMADQDVPGQ